jgi:hypothetical protein
VWLRDNGNSRVPPGKERQPESSLLLRTGNGAAVMKKRMVLGVLPAIGLSAIPTFACPACLPALASLLSAIGLTFLTKSQYLVWVNFAALGLALTILFMRPSGERIRSLPAGYHRGGGNHAREVRD